MTAEQNYPIQPAGEKQDPDPGRPEAGSGKGRRDYTGITPEGVHVDPEITEGHPGYDESGHSEFSPVPAPAQKSTGTAVSWVREMLDRRGVAYEELHHPEAYTAQEVAGAEHVSGHRFAKVVVVMADGQPVELVLPASRHVQMERVRGLLNAKEVRLATEAEMENFFSDCEVGAMPPLRHWKDMVVLMDESMKVEGDIVFQAGTHRDAVRLRFSDWFDLAKPQVASFSAPGA